MTNPGVFAFVALGSNLGDRRAAIDAALAHLSRAPGINFLDVAPIIQTAPIGPPGQGDYLNTAAALKTTLDPRALLDTLLAIERAIGRERSAAVRWGPRLIDLDLLLYAEAIIDQPGLVVPHPHLHERRFVLEPLAAIAPAARHPVLHRTIAQLLADLGPAT